MISVVRVAQNKRFHYHIYLAGFVFTCAVFPISRDSYAKLMQRGCLEKKVNGKRLAVILAEVFQIKSFTAG